MLKGIRTSWVVVAATIACAAFAQATAGTQASPQRSQKTVLDGVFTAAQADRGSTVYGAECAACHDGADVDGPSLTGDPFIDRWREDPLAGLFAFIQTRMPQPAPGSLSDAVYLDIVAHLLRENGFHIGSRELTMDALASTLLVGRNGPQPLPNGALVRVVGCLAQNPAREWIIARAGQPSRVRVGNEIAAEEATAAAGAALGTQTFTLQNVGDAGTPLPGNEGQKVVVKGALSRRGDAGRIHVTAAKSVAPTCA